jgi:hypothetical protein
MEELIYGERKRDLLPDQRRADALVRVVERLPGGMS